MEINIFTYCHWKNCKPKSDHPSRVPKPS